MRMSTSKKEKIAWMPWKLGARVWWGISKHKDSMHPDECVIFTVQHIAFPCLFNAFKNWIQSSEDYTVEKQMHMYKLSLFTFVYMLLDNWINEAFGTMQTVLLIEYWNKKPPQNYHWWYRKYRCYHLMHLYRADFMVTNHDRKKIKMPIGAQSITDFWIGLLSFLIDHTRSTNWENNGHFTPRVQSNRFPPPPNIFSFWKSDRVIYWTAVWTCVLFWCTCREWTLNTPHA